MSLRIYVTLQDLPSVVLQTMAEAIRKAKENGEFFDITIETERDGRTVEWEISGYNLHDGADFIATYKGSCVDLGANLLEENMYSTSDILAEIARREGKDLPQPFETVTIDLGEGNTLTLIGHERDTIVSAVGDMIERNQARFYDFTTVNAQAVINVVRLGNPLTDASGGKFAVTIVKPCIHSVDGRQGGVAFHGVKVVYRGAMLYKQLRDFFKAE